MITWDFVTNLKHISTNTMAKATKLVRVTTYRQRFTLIKLQSPLIMSSYEITWKTKNIYLDCHNAIRSHDHLNKWLCEVMWQIKNIKSQLSQCLWSTTCQRGEILPGAPTHKFTGPFNYKVLWLFFEACR